MTPNEFKAEMKSRLNRLKANRDADVLRISFDLIAQVRLRVQTSGENYLDRPFNPYTPGYSKQRAKSGYQVGYVDFTRTGRLWASIRPEVISRTENVTTVETTARTAQDVNKLLGARRKRGNILLPSQGEIEIAREANRQRVLKYLR